MAFLDENKNDVVDGRRLGVEPTCSVLQLASSTYYAARERLPSARAARDAELALEIWKANYEVYGSRKLWNAVRRAEIDIGRDQTRRLMHQAGIQGAHRSNQVRTTRRDRGSALTLILLTRGPITLTLPHARTVK